MKHLLRLLLLLFLSVPALAQIPDTAVLRITQLPENGLLLAQGWRYQVGDNPQWARPDFDDRAWDTLNPSRPRKELPVALGQGISWLRLRFRLSDSLHLRALMLLGGGPLSATEVYLNGRLVQRRGTLAADPKQVRPRAISFPDPIPLALAGAGVGEWVLAVRLAPWKPPLSHVLESSLHFNLRLLAGAQFRKLEAEGANVSLVYFGSACVAGLLMVLHLAFFYFNPAQRANLYFALYAGAMGLSALWTFLTTQANFFASLGEYLLFDFVGGNVLICLSGLWAIRALYSLFSFPPGRIYIGLWASCAVLLGVTGFYFYASSGFVVFNVAMALLTLEVLRLTGRALRQRQRGAVIIGTGFAMGLLGIVGLTIVVLGLVEVSWVVHNLMAFPLIFLPPALGISLYLAREFALDSQLLQVKLSEVERLSAQTLAQEQDKQALLAAQNETLEQQVQQRTGELQRSLTELRTTQAQLIQKEKMASLGELTAGIAHEIQNPLNFVTNFSDVSAELMLELQEAHLVGDGEEVTALAGDVTENLTKIRQHGQRASSIVRGMLEHARPSSGERQSTNINELCEEYLRLAYQGQRTKNALFEAEVTTDFAPQLPPVNLVAADVGRVLLNLYTNAFYALQQRRQFGIAGYEPTLHVTTEQRDGQVEIRVCDNGPGMDEAVQAKIFQPFFTTKPTGEGTGLGLSLSYDIITQGHGGSLIVESQEGQGTTFTIILPG